MTIEEILKEMHLLIQECEDDVIKVESQKRGSPKAGIRLRKQMRIIQTLAKRVQQKVQEKKVIQFDEKETT